MKRSSYLRSAAVLSLGGIFAKLIGAAYRIPLSDLLGGYGMGLYQMAYPLFCVLLTFSSAGIPSALSRTIARETARGDGSAATLKTALSLFALLGLCGTALMCLFAPLMSGLQGERELLYCYLALAPSVAIVALIAVLRGYLQGKNDMRPTAVSEIVEQVVKAAAGLFFAYRFRAEPVRAVQYCLLAVTLSELFALLYLSAEARGRERRLPSLKKTSAGEVFFSALPVMAATGLLPLSQTADSILLVRLLARHTPRAVTLYGLFAGGAASLVSLPATACYGLAAAAIPSVSRAFACGEEGEGRVRAVRALLITLALAAPCALGLFFCAPKIVSLLYRSLPPADRALLVSLIKTMAISAVSLAGVNTLAACLTGMGRARHAARSMLLAVLVKTALELLLVSDPAYSVTGAAIAVNLSYPIAFFLDLFYTVRKTKERVHDYDREPRDGAGRPFRQRHAGIKGGGRRARANGDRSLGADA